MTTIKRLPSAELNIMLVLWKTDKPVTAAYVMNQLKESQQKQLAITSVLTLLNKIKQKKALLKLINQRKPTFIRF